jgi:hypothetical protein
MAQMVVKLCCRRRRSIGVLERRAHGMEALGSDVDGTCLYELLKLLASAMACSRVTTYSPAQIVYQVFRVFNANT